MKFVKMHGVGNDFVVINGANVSLLESQFPIIAQRVCDRHFGVGSDGLIVVLPSRIANFRMRMFNPDGTEAEMCGNGIRCFAKYVYDRKMHQDSTLTVETLAGVKTLKLKTARGKVEAVRVDMGEPELRRSAIPMKGPDSPKVVAEPLRVGGKKFEVTCLSMGNPHCVTFVSRVQDYPVEKLGPQIETHPSFPKRTNVEFVEVISETEIRMRVWERGAGETLACGTGACAAAVAAMLNDKVHRKVNVYLHGGTLFIEWLGDNRVQMTGPAEEVFEGEINADLLKKWV